MKKTEIIDFSRFSAYHELLNKLKEEGKRTPISLPRSVRLPFLADLQREWDAPIVFITSRPDRLQTMHEEFGFWTELQDHLIFAEPTPLFYERTGWSLDIKRDRLLTLETLARYYLPAIDQEKAAPVIFTSAKAIMQRTVPRRTFLKSIQKISAGKEYDMGELTRKWVNLGYEFAEIVVAPGQFSRRGGLLDIWPMTINEPVRIEFFGNEVESMRMFDPATQRSSEIIDKVVVSPAGEVISDSILGIEDPERASAPEFNIPLIYSSSATLLDFLPAGSVVLIDNASSVKATAEEVESQALKVRDENIGAGILDPSFPIPYVTWSEIEDHLGRFSSIDLGFPLEKEGHTLSASFSPAPRFGGRMADFLGFIEENTKIHR